MKHFLVILLMSLLFSSCMKNYPEMVYEKALQYQQEGKYTKVSHPKIVG